MGNNLTRDKMGRAERKCLEVWLSLVLLSSRDGAAEAQSAAFRRRQDRRRRGPVIAEGGVSVPVESVS